jgi:hypothetical protein
MSALEVARQALGDALIAGEDTSALRPEVKRLQAEAADAAAANARAAQAASDVVEAQIEAEAAALVQADDERRRQWLSQFNHE